MTKTSLARKDGRHHLSVRLITGAVIMVPGLLLSPSSILASAATVDYTFSNQTNSNSTSLEDTLPNSPTISHATSSQTTLYDIYTVPKFKCLFSFNSSYGNYHETEALPLLLSIGGDLDSITEKYLATTINDVFASSESGTGGVSLHVVDLDVNVKGLLDGSFRRHLLRRELGDTSSQPLVQAEITGEAIFTQPSTSSTSRNSSGLTLTQDKVRNLISSSFSTQTEVSRFLTLLQQNSLGSEVLRSIAGVTVYTNVDYAVDADVSTIGSNGVSAGVIESDFYQTAANGGMSASSSAADKESNVIQTGVVFAIGCAIVIMVAGLYVYASKKFHAKRNVEYDTMTDTHHKRSKSGRKRFGDVDDIVMIDAVDSFDRDEADLNGAVNENGKQWLDVNGNESHKISEHDGFSKRSFRSEKDGDAIPVPARSNEIVSISPSKMTQQSVTPRRYVKPTSPFEVLYGASYSHEDQEQVENPIHVHHQSKKPKSPQNSEKRTKNRRGSIPKANITPMMSIAETEEERDYNLSHSQEIHSSFFPTIMTSITSYLTERKVANDGRRDHEIVFEKNNKVVFHDFPRHDGTPCLMYTARDEMSEYKKRQEWRSHDEKTYINGDYLDMPTLNNAPPRSVFNNRPESDDDHSHKSDSTSSSNVPAGIDNFVDTLEKLITAKSRQYQERVKMDKERAERKKAHEEKRRKGRAESHAITENSKDAVCAREQGKGEKDAGFALSNASIANLDRSQSPPASKSLDLRDNLFSSNVVSPDQPSEWTENENDRSPIQRFEPKTMIKESPRSRGFEEMAGRGPSAISTTIPFDCMSQSSAPVSPISNDNQSDQHSL